MILHCSFNLHFSSKEQWWAPFHVFVSQWHLWRSVCLVLFPSFWFFFFLALSCMSWLYILKINPLLVVSFAIISSTFEGCLFTLAYSFLCCAKAFKFYQVPLVYFCFYFCYSRRCVIEDLSFMSESVLPMFSSKSLLVSGLAFRSLIHFEFIFVYNVMKI